MYIKHILRYALIFLLCLTTAVSAAPAPTNMDMVVNVLEAAVDDALGEMKPPSGTVPLFIASQKKHAADWLVEHILTQRLLARGFAVTLDSTAAVPDGPRLSYRVLDLGVSAGAGLLSRKIKRRTWTNLALQLSEGKDQLLLWRHEVGKVENDRVAKSRMDLLQNDKYKFALTEVEERTWSKFVEPVILSTVLGGLIYLFFSNR